MSPTRRRLIALAYGILCHGLFALGVGAMVLNLFGGMQGGFGPLRGGWALAANTLLLIQFPLVHSFLMTRRGRRWMRRLAPTSLAEDLSTTLFATIASLQLIAVFCLWSPSGTVWWRPQGRALVVATTGYAAAWIFLQKALWDARLAVQSGYLGWSAVYRGRPPEYGTFPTHGLFRFVRQPVYLGFALTLWTGPVWTPDRLALALAWTAYCLLGPLLKERRYTRRHGPAFRRYQERVGYMVPARIVPGIKRLRYPRSWLGAPGGWSTPSGHR